MIGAWRSRDRTPLEPCNATELMLRSGRTGAPVAVALDGQSAGLDDLVQRLGIALVLLGPYRESPDVRLRRAYRAVHGAMSELATVFLQLSATRPAARARPARRRRPWGARS